MHSEILRSFAQSVLECNSGFQLEHHRPGWAVESILVSFVPLCKTRDTNQLRPNVSTPYDGLLGYTADNFWMGAGWVSYMDPSFKRGLPNSRHCLESLQHLITVAGTVLTASTTVSRNVRSLAMTLQAGYVVTTGLRHVHQMLHCRTDVIG